MPQPSIPRPRVWRGLAVGTLWMVVLWGWMTGYWLSGHVVSKVARVTTFTISRE